MEMWTEDTQIIPLAKLASVCRHADHTAGMKAVPVFPEGQLDKVAVQVNEKSTKIKWNIN